MRPGPSKWTSCCTRLLQADPVPTAEHGHSSLCLWLPHAPLSNGAFIPGKWPGAAMVRAKGVCTTAGEELVDPPAEPMASDGVQRCPASRWRVTEELVTSVPATTTSSRQCTCEPALTSGACTLTQDPAQVPAVAARSRSPAGLAQMPALVLESQVAPGSDETSLGLHWQEPACQGTQQMPEESATWHGAGTAEPGDRCAGQGRAGHQEIQATTPAGAFPVRESQPQMSLGLGPWGHLLSIPPPLQRLRPP